MAVNAANTKAGLDALYKDVYGDKLTDLRPDFGILMDKIKFREGKKTGRDFVEPVQLTHEHGFTYGQGLVTLADIVVSQNEEAKVRGNSLTLRTAFAYDAAANMVQGGKESFIRGTEYKFRTMMESATYRLEAQMLHGSDSLGTVKTSAANDTDDTVEITDASWAPGLWSGAEQASIDIYSADKVTLRGTYTVESIDTSGKILAVPTASTLQTDGVVAGDVIMFAGSKGNEMVGLSSIAANSGTLYGINGAGYGLWQGNTSAVAGNLTLKKLYQGINGAVGKGLMETVCVLVSPATFSTLANDEASLRRYNAAGTKAVNGSEAIEFHGTNGLIKIVVHPMVKEGQAIAFPEGKAERIGATDITFKTPGRQDEMFQQIPDQTGYECRLYSEQALYLPCPAKCVSFSGITNA